MEKYDDAETEGNQNHEAKVNFDSANVNDSNVSSSYHDMTNHAMERNDDSIAIMLPTMEEEGAKVMTSDAVIHASALDLQDVLNALNQVGTTI